MSPAAQRVRMPLVAALLLVVALAVAGCGGADSGQRPTPGLATVDPVTLELLEAHGLRPAGATASSQVTVGDLEDLPWALYLEVSRSIGLDFSPLEGQLAELRSTRIERTNPDAAVYVLVHEGRPAGAWLDPGGSSSGVLSLSDRP
jgi:hypothetical protein